MFCRNNNEILFFPSKKPRKRAFAQSDVTCLPSLRRQAGFFIPAVEPATLKSQAGAWANVVFLEQTNSLPHPPGNVT